MEVALDKQQIDLQKERSEPEMQEVLDRFYLAATPKYFEWLGWVAALAAVTYLKNKHGGFALSAILTIGYVLLFSYFQAFFYRFELVVNKKWSARTRRWFSLGLSAILAFVTSYLVIKVLKVMSAATS